MNNSMPTCGIIVKVGVFLIVMLMIANGSDALSSVSSIFDRMMHRKLVAHDHDQSPSPAPQPSLPSDSAGLVDTETDERCSGLQTTNVTKSCQGEGFNITACLAHLPAAPKEFFLLVENDGEDSLKVNITILHTKVNPTEIEIPKQKAKKINIPENVKGSPLITLSAGNGKCKIRMDSLEPDSKFDMQWSAYTNNLSPIHGAYFLFLTALIIGGIWVCCKFGRSDQQHVNGVKYQELEMGQPDSHSAITVETAEGWHEGWDDTWEEKEIVKSPNGHQRGYANGLTSRTSKADGWENDWED